MSDNEKEEGEDEAESDLAKEEEDEEEEQEEQEKKKENKEQQTLSVKYYRCAQYAQYEIGDIDEDEDEDDPVDEGDNEEEEDDDGDGDYNRILMEKMMADKCFNTEKPPTPCCKHAGPFYQGVVMWDSRNVLQHKDYLIICNFNPETVHVIQSPANMLKKLSSSCRHEITLEPGDHVLFERLRKKAFVLGKVYLTELADSDIELIAHYRRPPWLCKPNIEPNGEGNIESNIEPNGEQKEANEQTAEDKVANNIEIDADCNRAHQQFENTPIVIGPMFEKAFTDLKPLKCPNGFNFEKQYPLPVEILLQIFVYLSPRDFYNCLLVCKSWHLLVRDRSLNCIWFAHVKNELLRRMTVKAKGQIQIRFRFMDRLNEMKSALSRNVMHLISCLEGLMVMEELPNSSFLLYSLLFRRVPERDSNEEDCQPFARMSTVLDFLLTISIHALDLVALLYRIAQESSVFSRTSLPASNPLKPWLASRESQRNLLRAVCRHFASLSFKVLKKLDVKPHLYNKFVQEMGKEALQQSDHAYWLFDFADRCKDCPEYIRRWILQRDQGGIKEGSGETKVLLSFDE